MSRLGMLCAAALLLALPCARAAGTWTPTGSMGTARCSQTSTLLQNGKVLVAGGWDSGGNPLASAELYDPVTGSWSAAASLATARVAHSATLLASGKVLVAGGSNAGGYVASAELYDAGTNTLSPAGNLATARSHQTATLLPNGKVLVAGGQNSGGSLASAELYDPGTSTWSAAASLTTARTESNAALLPTGKVLVVGGVSGASLASAELYDPGTNTWSAAASLATARFNPTVTLLPNGSVLVAAGGGDGGVYLASAELYDPVTNTWSAAGSLTTSGRRLDAATLLPSGKVLVAAGVTTGNVSLVTTELYDPQSNIWSATASLAAARGASSATLLPSGSVLVAGGYCNGGDLLSSCELYDYATADGSWSATGFLATGRAGHSTTALPNGKVLAAGGGAGAVVTASCELYDPATGTWSATGSMSTGREAHAATLLNNGRVLVAGGHDGITYLPSAEVYDPATGTWSATGSLTTARNNFLTTLLGNGKVLVAGGENAGGFVNSAELYDPITGSWGATGSVATARRLHAQVLLSTGKVLVAGGENAGGSVNSAELYDPITGTWTATGSLATARSVFPATLLGNGKVLAAGGAPSTSSCELYDPAAGTWSPTGSMGTARGGAPAVLLTNGYVLAAAGAGYLSSCELYNPVAGTWSTTGPLATGRQTESRAMTLLSSGKVLYAGGYNGSDLSSCELYDPGAGFQEAWRPVINTATSPLNLGSALTVGGTQFKGISEASGGGYQSSATNYPLVQLRSLVNEQTAFLLPDPANNWSDTVFTSKAVTGFPTGNALVTVFTNGIPSVSKTIVIADGAPTITSATTASGTYGVAFSYTITATANPTSYGATGLPAGLSVNASTGAITGTPSAAGQADVNISASNATGTGQATLNLTIAKAAATVTISSVNQTYDGTAKTVTATTTPVALTVNVTYDGSATAPTNAGTYTVVATINDANYQGSATATLTVAKAAATVTIGSVNQTYDGTAKAVTVTTTPVGLTVNITYDGSATAPSAPGSYSVLATVNELNYQGSATATLTIAKVAAVIGWNNPADIIYPTPLSATQLNATASVPGSFAYSAASGAVLNAGTQTISVQFTPTDGANYSNASANVSVNVLKGTPVVTWNNPADIVYPAPLSATQLNATATTTGTFAYTPASGTVLNAGTSETLVVQFTPADTGNWNTPAAVNAAINVLKGTPVIVWNNPADVTYPYTLGTTQLNATVEGNVAGTFAYSPPAGTELNAGAGQTLSCTFTPTDTANYDSASKTVALNVAVGIVSLTAAPNPAEPGMTITFTVAGANSDRATWDFGDGTPVATGASVTHAYLAAGTYTVKVTLSDGVTTTGQTFTVEVSNLNSRVIGNFVIAPNPADAGQEMTFTATANKNAGGKVTFSWSFGDGATDLAVGDPEVQVTTKHAYAQPGDYPVVLTARDAGGKAIGSVSQTAYVTAPNAPRDNNAISRPALENKLNGLAVKVADKVASIVALDVQLDTLRREAFEVGTEFGEGIRSAVKGTRPVHKYEAAGLYVATTRAFDIDTGSEQGKMRKTIPISRLDTGETPLVDNVPTDGSIGLQGIKGKLYFSDLKNDAVSLAATIELPEGYDVRREHWLEIAVGNIVDAVTLTNKGTAASQGNNFYIAKLQMKYPKLAKGTYKTSGGQKAKLSATLTAKNMSAKGFDTEGIVAQWAPEEAGAKSVQRSLQMALLLDGVAYELVAGVQFKLSKDTGQLAGRGTR